MRITIYWVTNDWRTIRAIRRKYRLPDYMTVNGLTTADVDEETITCLRRGEPDYLIIRNYEPTDKDNEK